MKIIEAGEHSEFSPDLLIVNDSISERAAAISGSLIDTPSALPGFLNSVSDARLIAEESGDRSQQEMLKKLLIKISVGLASYDWASKQETELPLEDAKGLLLGLITTQPKDPNKKSQDRIVAENLFRGYAENRFQRRGVSEWRGALLSNRRFMEAAVFPDLDIEVAKFWDELQHNGHPDILGNLSIVHRADFLAKQAADPKDEEYLATAWEVTNSIALTGLATRGMREIPTDVLSIMRDAARIAMYDGTDINSPTGKRYYKKAIEILKSAPENRRLPASAFREASNASVTPDIAEIALQSLQFPERFDLIIKLSERIAEQNKEIGFAEISGGRDAEIAFPDKFVLAQSELTRRYNELVERSLKKDQLKEMAEKMAEKKGKNWHVEPFSFREASGYLLSSSHLPKIPSERVSYIQNIVLMKDRDGALDQVLQVRREGGSFAGMVDLPEKKATIIFVDQGLSAKSELETVLDMEVSQDLREQSQRLTRTNIELARQLPMRFRRRPTRAGDKYFLLDHEDLPGIIQKAVIQKKEGGMAFTLDFANQEIVGDVDMSLSGRFNFQYGRVNILYGEESPSLPQDLRALMDNVLLHLIERSCCPTIQEVEEERERIETEGKSMKSIPGYIAHVGGFRASGDRKQYTRYAENNFQEALQELEFDAPGLSLANINQNHRDGHQKAGTADDRFLTYYKGREVEEEIFQEPTDREPPATLISINE